MAAPLRLWLFCQWWLFVLVFILAVVSPVHACLPNCTCSPGELEVDCSKAGLVLVPRDLPATVVRLNLSYNLLTSIDPSLFTELTNLSEVYLGHNELISVPSLGPLSSSITVLKLHHNQIQSINGSLLKLYTSLQVLDLNSNDLTEVRSTYFPPGLRIKELYLGSNKISILEHGAFNSLARSLQVLRLSKNRIAHLPVKAFTLPRLTQLDLNRNKLRLIEGLTFQGLDSLEVLKLQRNNISKLTDGAFWGLTKMQVLYLDNNSLTEVTSGSLYGLSSLHQLYLGGNSINRISPDSWRFCEKLHELSLSYNNLVRLDKGSLAGLSSLHTLRMSHNSLSHIAEGAFRGLKALRNLELDHNEISGAIEDTSGAFAGLDNLNKLMLFGNKIKSVARKAFSGLEALEHLNLGNNAIRSIHPDAFTRMKKMKELYMNSDGFLCDCQLKWLPQWLAVKGFQTTVEATCAHPEPLKNRSIFTVPAESFVCDDFPKPQIILQPESTVAVLGRDVRFTCSAASSSSSAMTFAWKKDNEILHDAEIENFAHVRARDGEVMEYTTILHLRHVTFADEGRYQCIITNHFGSTYSNKTRLTVNVLPSFIKTPSDLTIRTGGKARLECAAEGHPAPQIAWQKDGGTDFPAARERRMHIMPDDDVLFITNVKIDDMGVYSCTAQNSAGTVSANASLTVLETPSLVHPLEDHTAAIGETVALQCKATGSPPPRVTWLKDDGPLQITERHHYTRGNQLLIIQNAVLEDSGKYTCEMSNTLGTKRAYSHLKIMSSQACVQQFPGKDGSMAVGIIVIAVVCSILITSFVWVCIIYQTRKKSEEYSVTNTDETVVPPDVPSYLSSQGTLSDRQETCIRAEGSSTLQRNGHIESNGECSIIPVVCTDCHDNAVFYSADREYFPQTFKPVDKSYEMPMDNKPVKEGSNNFTSSTTMCNGTPVVPKGNRKFASFPSNHDRIASSHTCISSAGLGNTKDPPAQTSEPPPTNLHPSSLDDLNHQPSVLCGNLQTLLDSQNEVKQTLLSNGHLIKSLDSNSECTPLRRTSD